MALGVSAGTSIDEIDRKILLLLQQDARMTNAAVAAEVGLSAPSVFERIRKLEQRGVIKGYMARVDPAALGKGLTAFIRLTLADGEGYATGVEAIADDPDVLECYHVAGEDCFLLKTIVRDPSELDALLKRIRARAPVQRSVTMIALSAVKESSPIDVSEKVLS